MKKLGAALLTTLLVAAPLAQAKMVNDVDVADKIQVADQSLTLNGAGVRSKFFMDLYVGALYLNNHSITNTSTCISKLVYLKTGICCNSKF